MKCTASGLVGFTLGVAAAWLAYTWHAQVAPPMPTLKPAAAIRVTLYPFEKFGEKGGETAEVPVAELDRMTILLTPKRYFGPSMNDHIFPLIAVATVTHPDGTQTTVLIRAAGKNPAAISLDGRNYFYADTPPDVSDGSAEIAKLVTQQVKKTAGSGFRE